MEVGSPVPTQDLLERRPGRRIKDIFLVGFEGVGAAEGCCGIDCIRISSGCPLDSCSSVSIFLVLVLVGGFVTLGVDSGCLLDSYSSVSVSFSW